MSSMRMLVFVTSLALAATAATAQTKSDASATKQSKSEAAAPAAGQLEEVIVTAERREAKLQSVPIPVTALTTETLENRQVSETKDLERYVPSLRMSTNITSPTNLSPSLRGSLQQDASLIVAESPFGIYVDAVYVGRLNGNNITLADVERVEVLRGPQGTLYGRNTLTGAIKFITRTPDKTGWFNAKAGYGNHGQYLASLSAGGPLSDSWAGSFSAQDTHKDGESSNRLTNKPRGMEESWAARGKLHYMGSEKFDAVLSVSYADSKNDSNQMINMTTPNVPANRQFTSDDVVPTYGLRVVSTPDVARTPAILGNQPSGWTKQTIASANLSYDFGSATLRSITGYVKTKDYFTTDFSGKGTVVGGSALDDNEYTEELQLQGKAFDNKLNYLLGAYYLRETGDQDFGWAFFTPTSTSQQNVKTDSISGFGQVDYQFTDALKGTAGVRWSQDKKDWHIDFQRLPTSVVPGPATDSVSLKNTYSEVTPKFGLDYKVVAEGFDSLLYYVSAARGFKSGGYSGIAIFGLSDSRDPYAPETNWTYEGGVKADMLNRRLRVNANVFYEKAKDLALNATVQIGVDANNNPLFGFPVQNAGEATIKGLELEVTAVPTENLTMFMNASFLHGAYGTLKAGSAPANAPRDFGVQPTPPQLPSYTMTLGFEYGKEVAIGANGGRVKVGMDVYRTDDYVTAATNDFIVKAYDRWNGYVGLDLGDKWDVRLSMKNIRGEDQVFVGSRGLGGFLVMPPREWMFTVGYKL